ncbi:MAG: ATP-binding protein [Thermoplasmata archaeon]|nr:ATP-binding protein [Candidatus Sysuiplasma jiujiangense]
MPVDELTNDEYAVIRASHGKASGYLVREIAKGNDNILEVGLSDGGVRRYLPFVATLCERHQSSVEFDPHENSPLGEGNVRIGVLTGLLRISDELDCSFRRVDMSKIGQYGLSPESILHWLNCYYIDAVTIENGSVRICASYPDSISGPVISYLSENLLGKLGRELGIVEDALWDNNIKLHFPRKLQTTDSALSSVKQGLPESVLDIIRPRLTTAAPKRVESIPSSDADIIEGDDWMSYWKFIGNPFIDIPMAFGSDRFVETPSSKTILSEVGGYLRGNNGELKLLIAGRGFGKTTLFQSIKSRFDSRYDVIMTDVADRISNVRTSADIYNIVCKSIYRGVTGKGEDIDSERIVEAVRLGNKKIICVDSLDRLPSDKDPLVVDFFKSSQYLLSRLREVSIVVFACAERWGQFLSSSELSYVGYRNAWELSPFSTQDVQNLLERRLISSGSSYDKVFAQGCSSLFRTLSGGNPRQALILAEAICRYGAQKKQTVISKDFIIEQYQRDFDNAIGKSIDRLVLVDSEARDGMISIYHYYLEMERRGMNAAEGWNYLIELVERGLPADKVQPSFITPLKYIANRSLMLSNGSSVYAANKGLKSLFKGLRKDNYSVRDFVTYYSTNPTPPESKDDDLEVRFKSPLLLGPDIIFYENAREIYISLRRSTAPPFQIISMAWDCVENLMFAILCKLGNTDVDALIVKKEEWFYEDKYGVKRYVTGSGRLRAEHAQLVTGKLLECLKSKHIWMDSLNSLIWIRSARGNVVRGRTEHLSKYGKTDQELCLKHLDQVFRELTKIYG